MKTILNNGAALTPLAGVEFTKMHGLGNDFIVFDARDDDVRVALRALGQEQIRALSDRKSGIGCDQLIIIEPATSQTDAKTDKAPDAFMRIYNADGSEVSACGNATRCVGRVLMTDNRKSEAFIETAAGLLKTCRADSELITADMGPALLDWQQIPLSQDKDTLSLPILFGELENPAAVSVGNPHCVFFVSDVDDIDLPAMGPAIEHHPLFPERTNVEIAQLLSPNRLRMRVWERGVGITQACGTGACATVVAAARRGITDRKADVVLDGGTLHIEWNQKTNHILMTGPAALAFKGKIEEI